MFIYNPSYIQKTFLDGDQSASDSGSEQDLQTTKVSMEYCRRLKCNYWNFTCARLKKIALTVAL